MITKEDGVSKLREIVKNEIKNSGYWFFNKRDITLSITRILEPYEKRANLPLPEKLNLNQIIIDKNGVLTLDQMIKWNEICVTGIVTEKTYNAVTEKDDYEKELLMLLHTGFVKRYSIGDTRSYHGLIGHFIEQYKMESTSLK